MSRRCRWPRSRQCPERRRWDHSGAGWPQDACGRKYTLLPATVRQSSDFSTLNLINRPRSCSISVWYFSISVPQLRGGFMAGMVSLASLKTYFISAGLFGALGVVAAPVLLAQAVEEHPAPIAQGAQVTQSECCPFRRPARMILPRSACRSGRTGAGRWPCQRWQARAPQRDGGHRHHVRRPDGAECGLAPGAGEICRTAAVVPAFVENSDRHHPVLPRQRPLAGVGHRAAAGNHRGRGAGQCDGLCAGHHADRRGRCGNPRHS